MTARKVYCLSQAPFCLVQEPPFRYKCPLGLSLPRASCTLQAPSCFLQESPTCCYFCLSQMSPGCHRRHPNLLHGQKTCLDIRPFKFPELDAQSFGQNFQNSPSKDNSTYCKPFILSQLLYTFLHFLHTLSIFKRLWLTFDWFYVSNWALCH